MKILICTPIKRANERVFYYPRAMQSIHGLRWRYQLDYHMPSGGDTSERGDVNVGRKYYDAQQITLKHGYDAMLCAESDMIIPPDALEKLAALDTDIAYGLYCWRKTRHQWNAYPKVEFLEGQSISANPEVARDCFGKVIPVQGIGQGCTLIHRRVLEAFDLRTTARRGCDHCMATDAQEFGFRQLCDLSVICGHIDGNQIIWPDASTPDLYRIENL